MSEKHHFDKWLTENATKIPLVAWGPQHTKIAEMYADYVSSQAVRETLDQALNSGDGSYRP